NQLIEFKINDFIKLKLEKGKTVIYVKDIKFLQCKYLLIEIPKERFKNFDNLASIDDVSEILDHSLERNKDYSLLDPKIEFWGHCSNLQAWFENLYDTRLLHSNLAFPLLKKLTDVGDPIARRVFKDEIVERLMSGHKNVAQYLIRENYLEYFNNEEIDLIMEIFFEKIEKRFKKKYGSTIDNIEIDALLDIVKVNINNSNTFLINNIKPIDNISKETHVGFSYEKNRIRAIGFNRCGLNVLPSSIEDFHNLKELYMTENRLKELPESIGNIRSLKKLNLSDNYLIRLPNQIGNLIDLVELYLNHNLIQSLPESITNLKNLEVFSIWGNHLKDLSKSMNQIDSLRVLGLSFNQLEEVPYHISYFMNLQVLDLSNNRIKIIPDNIGRLESLKGLWLNNNPIKTLPESLLDIESLKDLYIVNTPIAFKKEGELEDLFMRLEAKGVNIWK
ncbi:MAG: leucine-rich repeat domain-containing protein, partial [Promethearchaeota archaeon]